MANQYKRLLRGLLGKELMKEVERRVKDGQLKGQALINAGDHADEEFTWELYDKDVSVMYIDTWHELAAVMVEWNASRRPCDNGDGRAATTPLRFCKTCLDELSANYSH